MSDQEYPLPPATFEFLILSLKAQAEMHLGLYHFGDEKERPEPDFRVARHSIDLLAMLQEKTRGNVSMEEQRLVDNALTELRFRYVQAMEKKAVPAESAAQPAPPTATSGQSSSAESTPAPSEHTTPSQAETGQTTSEQTTPGRTVPSQAETGHTKTEEQAGA